ncbi:MAG TPA: MCE family protein [Phaeodactylibacter sp.]|nr:MCE family protein [Phaeodactylibacter sp.]
MKNETKIGILAIVTIALFIYGFKFIKGQNLLSSSQYIYVKYKQIDMLAMSSPVLINGFQVGVVSDIYIDDETMEDIIVVMDIKRSISIHKDAIAEIVSPSMMGGKAIRIVNNKPCTGANCASSRDFIQGRTLSLLEVMIPDEEMRSFVTNIKGSIGPAFDTLNQRIKDPYDDNIIGKTMQDLHISMANLKTTTDQINRLLAASSGSVSKTISNLESITDNAKASNLRITNMLANADSLMAALNDANIKQTIASANNTLNSTDVAIQQLKTTLQKADAALIGLGEILAQVKDGNGALAMLINDPNFATKLNHTVKDLDALLLDIKAHPYNYMPLKSRRKVTRWRKQDLQSGY